MDIKYQSIVLINKLITITQLRFCQVKYEFLTLLFTFTSTFRFFDLLVE